MGQTGLVTTIFSWDASLVAGSTYVGGGCDSIGMKKKVSAGLMALRHDRRISYWMSSTLFGLSRPSRNDSSGTGGRWSTEELNSAS